MKLVRYNQPGTSLSGWNSLFGDPFEAFAPFFRNSNRLTSYSSGLSQVSWFEDDDHYYARVEMPGVKKENLKVEVENGLLRLSCDSKSVKDDGGTYEAARYDRTLRIPEEIDPNAIAAKLEDGILSLTLPKAEEKKPVSIKIS